MSDKGNLLSLLDKTLQLGGAIVEKSFHLTIDGMQELISGVISIGCDFSTVNPSKVVDIFKVISTRRTIAKAIYPTDHIEKEIDKNPQNNKAKIDRVEQLERQFVFLLKLMEWMALTPVGKQMAKRVAGNIKQAKEDVGLSSIHYSEIKFILVEITEELDLAIEHNDETKLEELLFDYLRCKIILKSNNRLDEYFEIFKEMDEENFNYLYGKYLFISGDLERAFEYLLKAYEYKIEYAEDDLTRCLDELAQNNNVKEKWVKKKRELFGGLFSESNVDTLKGLPFVFLQLKWKEIVKVFNNIKGDKCA